MVATSRIYDSTSLSLLWIIDNRRLKLAERSLKQRYGECDKNGHRIFKENICQHCYRRREYTPELVELIKKTEPIVFPPLSIKLTSDLIDEINGDIESLKRRDYANGLAKILIQLQ